MKKDEFNVPLRPCKGFRNVKKLKTFKSMSHQHKNQANTALLSKEAFTKKFKLYTNHITT